MEQIAHYKQIKHKFLLPNMTGKSLNVLNDYSVTVLHFMNDHSVIDLHFMNDCSVIGGAAL